MAPLLKIVLVLVHVSLCLHNCSCAEAHVHTYIYMEISMHIHVSLRVCAHMQLVLDSGKTLNIIFNSALSEDSLATKTMTCIDTVATNKAELFFNPTSLFTEPSP